MRWAKASLEDQIKIFACHVSAVFYLFNKVSASGLCDAFVILMENYELNLFHNNPSGIMRS